MSMANETMNLSEKDDTNFFVRVVRYFIPWKGDRAGEVFRKIVFMFSIVLFCVSLNELSDFLKADEQDQSYIQEIVNYEPDFSDNVDLSKNNGSDDIDVSDPEASTKDREVQDWAKKLLKRNKDVVGWIKIPGFKNSAGDEYINLSLIHI